MEAHEAALRERDAALQRREAAAAAAAAAAADAGAGMFAGRRRLFESAGPAEGGEAPVVGAAAEEESPRVGPSPPQLLPADVAPRLRPVFDPASTSQELLSRARAAAAGSGSGAENVSPNRLPARRLTLDDADAAAGGGKAVAAGTWYAAAAAGMAGLASWLPPEADSASPPHPVAPGGGAFELPAAAGPAAPGDARGGEARPASAQRSLKAAPAAVAGRPQPMVAASRPRGPPGGGALDLCAGRLLEMRRDRAAPGRSPAAHSPAAPVVVRGAAKAVTPSKPVTPVKASPARAGTTPVRPASATRAVTAGGTGTPVRERGPTPRSGWR